MDTKPATKLLTAHKLEVLNWNGSFTEATVKTMTGSTVVVNTRGGKGRVEDVLKAMGLYQFSKKELKRERNQAEKTVP